MPPPRHPTRRSAFTTPVVDYEPPPLGGPAAGGCPTPSQAALRRPSRRPLRPTPTAAATPRTGEPPPPRAAAVFADAALRRVLEVTDRRRPVAQLRPLLVPGLFDAVATLVGPTAPEGTAVLRRMRLRSVNAVDGEVRAAEVFATYSRGRRVRAIAGRVELVDGRWRVSALQIG